MISQSWVVMNKLAVNFNLRLDYDTIPDWNWHRKDATLCHAAAEPQRGVAENKTAA